MKRVAVLNDLSGMGKCSLTAALPVISVMGVQACPFPTAVLSNQTGYESYFCDDYTDRMDAYMAEWKLRGFRPDGIYTGFVAGAGQADKILKFIDEFAEPQTKLLVDPVLGDRGEAYKFYTEELCEKMRLLAQRAQVITPNLTEAMLLLGGRTDLEERWEALNLPDRRMRMEEIGLMCRELAERFALEAVVITGVDMEKTDGTAEIGNLVWEKEDFRWVFSEKIGGSYSGTGDLFASVLSAGMVRGISMYRCVKEAAAFLAKGISDAMAEGTDRNDGICFEPYLYELAEFVKEASL